MKKETVEIEQEMMDYDNELDINSINEIVKESESLIPSIKMDVSNNPATSKKDDDLDDLIDDKVLLDVYDEIMSNIKKDREDIDLLMCKFDDMLSNDGEHSTSTKEAIVNLMKIKTDTSDKAAKIADLMTRIKLKERNTFPRYLAAHQNNTINIDAKKSAITPAEKRALIEENKTKEGL